MFHTCNIMTCHGFTTGILAGCSFAWIAPVMIFFLVAFARKYIGEEGGIPFSFIGAIIGGMGAYLLIITFTCSYKFALIAGIIGAGLAGFFIGNMTEGG